jgi:hypothetical protein
MNVFYEYQTMLNEFKEDIAEGILAPADTIQILRSNKPVDDGYRPIIDWYYNDDVMTEDSYIDIFDDELEIQEKKHTAQQYKKDKPYLENVTVAKCLAEIKSRLREWTGNIVLCSPKKALEYYSRVYPSAWKQVDRLRAGRGKDLPFWPDWCFLPLSGAYAVVSTEAERQGIDVTDLKNLHLINDVGIVGALAAWRVTQGIYRFDPDVYQAVIDTPITGDLPHDILFNLPEWCIFVETPGLDFMGRRLNGYFAHLEYDAHDGRKELRLVLDHTRAESRVPVLISQVVHLGPWSLLEAIERAMKSAEHISKDLLGTDSPFPWEALQAVQGSVAPLISLLLYICSVNGEIGDGKRQPTNPKPKKTKKGRRIFPPNQVTTWDVGVRMGAALRRAKETAWHSEAQEPQEPGERTSLRPHVRRAHWHGYWTGPQKRKYVLKWLSPVLVGGKEVPVTIRPVE